MKRHIIIIAAVIIGMTLNACTINVDGESFGFKTVKGDGNVVTRDYDMAAFNAISTSLSATVNFTIADSYSCTVSLDENLFDYLDIKVKDNELLMGKRQEDKNTSLKATQFVIEVTAPSLENLNLAGSGTFNARAIWAVPNCLLTSWTLTLPVQATSKSLMARCARRRLMWLVLVILSFYVTMRVLKPTLPVQATSRLGSAANSRMASSDLAILATTATLSWKATKWEAGSSALATDFNESKSLFHTL